MARRAVKRRELPSEFRATAPTRLDFAGGWTDVPPFSAREGGVVVNGCIGLSARVDLKLGGALIRLVSEDLGQELECADSRGLVLDGRLDLVKAALRMFPVQSACTLTTRSDAPPGSGLGSSGALDVALVAALAGARGERLSGREIAEQAWYLETVEAKIPGGKQDQFAADHPGAGVRRGAPAADGPLLHRPVARLGRHHRARHGGVRAGRPGGDGGVAGDA